MPKEVRANSKDTFGPVTEGTRISSTSKVITMENTPSLNASIRPVDISLTRNNPNNGLPVSIVVIAQNPKHNFEFWA
jgi:hypothetical protein